MIDRPSFFFLRRWDRHPIGAVALARDGNVLLCAASLCHQSDQWNRTEAKNKAIGRLRGIKNPPARVTGNELLENVLDDLGFPTDFTDVDQDHAQSLFEKQCEFLLTNQPTKEV